MVITAQQKRRQDLAIFIALVLLAIGLAFLISWTFAKDLTNQPKVDTGIALVNTYTHPDGNVYDCIHYTDGSMHCTLGSDPNVGGGRIIP